MAETRPGFGLSTEEVWLEVYQRFQAALKINVLVIALVTAFVFCVKVFLGAYSITWVEFHLSLVLALGYCAATAVWNRASYRRRFRSASFHVYTVGVGLYLFNLVAIVLLVHFTGGAESLFVFTFALVALLSTFIAPPGLARILSATSVASYGVLLLIEYHGWFGRYYAGILVFSDRVSPQSATLTMFVIVSVVTALSVRIGRELFGTLERQRLALAAANSNLESLVSARTRELEEAVRELRGAYAALERDRDNQTRFYANITHELRTPINILLGASSNLKDGVYGPLNDAQRGGIEKMTQSARRLLFMIEDLLSLSRLKVGLLEYSPEDVALVVELEKACADIRGAAPGREIRVEWEPTAPELFPSDRLKLNHIVTNLIQNAVKYAEGPILIRASGDEASAFVEVMDQGPGVDEVDRDHIFEPFQRGRNARRHAGVGLGLPLARNLARLMGGDVSLVSSESGSIFRVRLPRTAQPTGGGEHGT